MTTPCTRNGSSSTSAEYYDVNAIRIDWCEPSAREYEVEYWVGADPMNWEEPAMDATGQGGEYLPVSSQAMGNWVRFPNGLVRDGKGGSVTRKLADNLISTRWVRVVMTQSSNRPGPHGNGRYSASRRLRNLRSLSWADWRPMASSRTSFSTHPTAPANRHLLFFHGSVAHGQRPQPAQRPDRLGIIFFTSGITNSLPALITVALIYNVPEDAAAICAPT